MNKRLKRCLASGAIMIAAGSAVASTVEMPAFAAFPATVKICNDTNSLDTNGGTTDGKNIDIDRSATSSYGVYSNELLPGDCTGNVNDPAKVTIDLTDDNANFTGGVGSAEIGIVNDGIDDSQGPWDMGCPDVATISNEAALPVTDPIANHSSSTNPIHVRIMPQAKCGANDLLNGRVCSDASSFDDFDAEGIGTNTYNNNLPPGECTNYFPIASDNANRMIIDLSNDAEYEVVAWKWKDNDAQTTFTTCDQDFGDDVGGVAGTGADVVMHEVAAKTMTVRNYLGVEDPDEGVCGGETIADQTVDAPEDNTGQGGIYDVPSEETAPASTPPGAPFDSTSCSDNDNVGCTEDE